MTMVPRATSVVGVRFREMKIKCRIGRVVVVNIIRHIRCLVYVAPSKQCAKQSINVCVPSAK